MQFDPWLLTITADARHGEFRREAQQARMARLLPSRGSGVGRLRRAAGDRLIRAGLRLAGPTYRGASGGGLATTGC